MHSVFVAKYYIYKIFRKVMTDIPSLKTQLGTG